MEILIEHEKHVYSFKIIHQDYYIIILYMYYCNYKSKDSKKISQKGKKKPLLMFELDALALLFAFI